MDCGDTPPGVIVNVEKLELPPGAGLKTVTAAVPAAEMSLTEIRALSWLLLKKVVGRSLPFQRTTELATKFWPFTSNWPFTFGLRTCSPSGAQLGLREVIAGTGFVALGGGSDPPGEGGGLLSD